MKKIGGKSIFAVQKYYFWRTKGKLWTANSPSASIQQ